MYNAINELSGDAAELKQQVRQYLDFSIRMSRRVALRTTQKYPRRKQRLSDIQLRQLLGAVNLLIEALDPENGSRN